MEPFQENFHQSGKPPSSVAPGTGSGQIRLRSPPTAELLEASVSSSPLLAGQHNNMLRRGYQPQHDSVSDKIHRYSGAVLIISITLMLILFAFFRMTLARNNRVFPSNRKLSTNSALQTRSSSNRYAVIFDAGSSGSRVHVFCFDQNLDLVHIGKELEVFEKLKPGLSAYATNPKEAAYSLLPLLQKAENVVPQHMHKNTPVKIGLSDFYDQRATAGLRQLGVDASERILQAVKDFLKVKSSLKSKDDWVTVLDGTQEGAYLWVAVNYLLKNIGEEFSDTVGVIDLGGGSVQRAYAISEANAANAPRIPSAEDTCVKEMLLMGTKYYLYVHSYLNYGLLAARAEILGAKKDSRNPCILAGYNGVYTYGGIDYKVSAPPSGSSMYQCRKEALKALKLDESTSTNINCTFGGVWNGGGGDGQNNLYVGFVDASKPFAKVHLLDFHVAAQRACRTTLEDAKANYPNVHPTNLPYLCMDLGNINKISWWRRRECANLSIPEEKIAESKANQSKDEGKKEGDEGSYMMRGYAGGAQEESRSRASESVDPKGVR
ncbi:hypothetical protein R6Q57_017009 [Mikania cordata]